ncbi:MAG: hypothetical protein MUC49_12395 [Raineya sp.]|jgi:hypothetical protein|nr:hypothetical protein [Raineya sp.]
MNWLDEIIKSSPILSFITSMGIGASISWVVIQKVYVKSKNNRILELETNNDNKDIKIKDLENELKQHKKINTLEENSSSSNVVKHNVEVPKTLAEIKPLVRDEKLTDLQKENREENLIGKSFIWEVVIGSISKGYNNDILVLFYDPSRKGGYASYNFKKEESGKLLMLDKNDIVKISGKISSFNRGDVSLEECVIIEKIKK